MLTTEQHRAFGRHSNIPECCIEYFITKGGECEAANRLRERVFPNYHGVSYTMCDTCFVGFKTGVVTPAVIHHCDPAKPNCAPFSRRAMAVR